MSQRKKPSSKTKKVVILTSPQFVPDSALSRPSPQHTVLVSCQGEKAGGSADCKGQRWCKPQDAWQVRLCLVCRAEKQQTKAKQQFESMKTKVEARAVVERERLYISRLQVLKFIWPTAKEKAAWAKTPLRRVWP